MGRRAWLLALLSKASAVAAVATPAASAENAAGATVEELVVTAEKREERLVDVPLSVQVVGGAQLDRQNISTLGDLAQAVPSLNAPGHTGGVAVRGVATTGFAHSSEQSVLIELDGVALGPAAINDLFDIERVEVLAGPQGMLFGKNASAGVVSIVTKAPDPTRFQVIGHADVGDYKFMRDQLTVNVPLAQTAALRVSGHYDRFGGYVKNVKTGQESETEDYGVRTRLLWEPIDKLKINLIADYDKTVSNGEPASTFGQAKAPGLIALLATCGIVASPTNDKECAEGISKVPNTIENFGGSIQVDYTLPGDFLLTSITAGRGQRLGDFGYTGLGNDTDLLPVNILSTNAAATKVDLFIQELRLTSPADKRLAYVAGLYFSDTKNDLLGRQGGTLSLVPPPLTIGRAWLTNIFQRSYAAYANGTFHVTPELSLVAGARYTDEFLKDVNVEYTNTSNPNVQQFGFSIFNPAFSIANTNARVKTSNFSWRVGAEYHFSRDVMAYATVARGYKGPAVNDTASPPLVNVVIEPEYPMYYELGAKGVFLDGRLLATIALFDNKVKDFQTQVFTPPTAANPVPGYAQGNAPWIHSQGIEANLAGNPVRGLNLNAGVIYNKAWYSPDFLVACSQELSPGQGDCTSVGGAGVTHPVSQLANTPKWRVLLNGEYARPITQSLTGFIQGDLVYTTKYDLSPTPNPMTRVGDQTFIGARVGVRAEDGRWGLSVFVRNLLDNTYPQFVGDPLAAFDGGGKTAYWTLPNLDWHRRWGVTLDARF
jgi:iron complex outermembrane receptor protein